MIFSFKIELYSFVSYSIVIECLYGLVTVVSEVFGSWILFLLRGFVSLNTDAFNTYFSKHLHSIVMISNDY